MARAPLLAAALLSAGAFLFFFQAYPNFASPNEYSRLMLVSAIVDDGTFRIGHALERYGDIQDKVLYKGRFYCDKPIGYSMLAVPAYAATVKLAGPLGADLLRYIMRIFVNLVPLLLFTLFFFRYLRNEVGAGPRAYLLIAAYLFGTLTYTYAQLFMSHLLVGLCWFVAFTWIAGRDSHRYAFAAGALMGFSFLLEVPSAVTTGVICLWLLGRKRSLLPAFLTGAALLSMPAFFYNYHLFGSPFEWAYKHMHDPEQRAGYAAGLIGWGMPSTGVFWQLTLGTSRGFFYYMPHLLFGLAGLVAERFRRAEAVLAGGIILASLVFYSGMHNWDGGWCFGPRYLVPLIPFLIYGCGLWLAPSGGDDSSGVGAARQALFVLYLVLVAVSIAAMLLGPATSPFTPPHPNSILSEHLIMFWGDLLGSSWGELAGLGPSFVRVICASLVILPVAILAWLSDLSRRELAAFLLALLLVLPASGLAARLVKPRIGALPCYTVGSVAYHQARYEPALEFFHEALEREPEAWVRAESERMIQIIESLGLGRSEPATGP